MNWKEFTVQIIDSLIWPLVVLAAIFLFRDTIRGIIAKLAKVKFKDLELGFTALSQEEKSNKLKEDSRLDLMSKDSFSTSCGKQTKERAIENISTAEDLVFRELEEDLNIRIYRYIKTVNGAEYDGYFNLSGIEVLLEIKYIARSNWKVLASLMRHKLEELNYHSFARRQFLVVVITDGLDDADVESGRDFLYKELREGPVIVKIKTFKIEELLKKYGFQYHSKS